MDLLLILTYTAICVVCFKVFRIPINKWTVPTAFLGGIAFIGLLIVVMNYNHPYSEIGRQYFVTTPITPAVSGRVVSVPVEPNKLLKAGDILFNIDPVPYKNKLASLEAQLVLAKSDLARAKELETKNAIAVRERETAEAKVDQLTAEKANAEFELSETTVRALTTGYVTQIAVQPGMYAVNLPLRPLMVFIHNDLSHFVGWFRQNSLLRLKVGDKAEVTFDGVPGVIFSGKVLWVFQDIAAGQVNPSGTLIDITPSNVPGRVPVIIEITDPNFKQYKEMIPGGAYGQTAIYTEHLKHVAIMRKILLRMAAWMNYLFPFH